MELMSYCKANIIANSTFSLCAAWLNRNENPIRNLSKKYSMVKCFPDYRVDRHILSSL